MAVLRQECLAPPLVERRSRRHKSRAQSRTTLAVERLAGGPLGSAGCEEQPQRQPDASHGYSTPFPKSKRDRCQPPWASQLQVERRRLALAAADQRPAEVDLPEVGDVDPVAGQQLEVPLGILVATLEMAISFSPTFSKKRGHEEAVSKTGWPACRTGGPAATSRIPSACVEAHQAATGRPLRAEITQGLVLARTSPRG